MVDGTYEIKACRLEDDAKLDVKEIRVGSVRQIGIHYYRITVPENVPKH